MGADSDTLRTIDRAFEVLDLLLELDGAGPSELAERLDLPRSTVHGYLRTLADLGYVVGEGGVYQVSHQFLEMGGRIKYRNKLFHVARPELERLAEETGEVAGLGVEEDGEVVVLHHERGDQALSAGLYPGMHTPMHVHAAGKVHLAFLPEERMTEILDEGLTASTEYTITDPDELRSELETIRDRGYAVDWDQQVKGMGMVAAPIRIDDEVRGSISILCPSGRITNESYRETLIQKTLEASHAAEVSYRYG